jgi:hypothetical protein
LREEDRNGIIEKDSVQIQNEDEKKAERYGHSNAFLKEELRNPDEVDVNKEVGMLQFGGLFLHSIELLDVMFLGAILLSMGLLIYWLQWF